MLPRFYARGMSDFMNPGVELYGLYILPPANQPCPVMAAIAAGTIASST
jgi:hypothetical protein